MTDSKRQPSRSPHKMAATRDSARNFLFFPFVSFLVVVVVLFVSIMKEGFFLFRSLIKCINLLASSSSPLLVCLLHSARFGSIRFSARLGSVRSLPLFFFFSSVFSIRPLDSTRLELWRSLLRVGLARNASSVSDSGARILGRKFSGCLVGLFVASPYRILELLIHFTNDGKSLFKFVGHHLRVDIVQSDERSYLPGRAERAPGYEKRMAINENWPDWRLDSGWRDSPGWRMARTGSWAWGSCRCLSRLQLGKRADATCVQWAPCRRPQLRSSSLRPACWQREVYWTRLWLSGRIGRQLTSWLPRSWRLHRYQETIRPSLEAWLCQRWGNLGRKGKSSGTQVNLKFNFPTPVSLTFFPIHIVWQLAHSAVGINLHGVQVGESVHQQWLLGELLIESVGDVVSRICAQDEYALSHFRQLNSQTAAEMKHNFKLPAQNSRSP